MWLRDLYEFGTLGTGGNGGIADVCPWTSQYKRTNEFVCRGCWGRGMQQGCQFLRYAFLPCQGTIGASPHPLGLLQRLYSPLVSGLSMRVSLICSRP
jgi:hypothetical protein